MMDAIKSGYRRALKMFRGAFGADAPTRNEMRLDADEWSVKRKLGRSFFTRQLNHNTRVARIMSLTEDENTIARNRGWI